MPHILSFILKSSLEDWAGDSPSITKETPIRFSFLHSFVQLPPMESPTLPYDEKNFRAKDIFERSG